MSYPLSTLCPRCGSNYSTRLGKNNRRFYECSNLGCCNNYNNMSKKIWGKHRYHSKLTPLDYVEIQKIAVELTNGGIAKLYGISRKHVSRILKLNLSTYAVKLKQSLSKGLNISST